MAKFSYQELSRILSAHEGGQLSPMGSWGYENRRCVIEAARNLYRVNVEGKPIGREFDDEYTHEWTTDEFLSWLESKGVA